jgi:hypothetical protein
MHSKRLILISAIILFLLVISISTSYAVEFLPKPKELKLGYSKTITLTSSVKISFSDDFRNKFSYSISEFNKTLSAFPEGNTELTITVRTLKDISNNLILNHTLDVLKRPGAYWISIKDKNIQVVGSDLMGTLYGLTTLEYLLKKNSGKIAEGEILDWPDHKTRAFHLVLKDGVSFKEAKEFLAKLRYGHYNTLVLMIVNWVKLDSMKELVTHKDAWSKEQFVEFVNYARGLGLEVVPEIKLLTHQEKLLKDKYPDLMFNKSTYDPGKEEVYKIIFHILDELISLIKPKAIHIGHDEVAGHNEKSRQKWLNEGEKMLPAELFLKDILRIHNYLSKKNIEVWMWGDMLIRKEEFPQMFHKHLHGNANYIAIRSKIPKDIVICDWHYFDKQKGFPSSKLFAELGHRVLGATWHKEDTIKNFSRYIANLPKNGEGMIATSWYSVKNKGWGTIEEIAAKSSEAFWNAR